MAKKPDIELVVGGKLIGPPQGRLQCDAARVLRRVANSLAAQVHGEDALRALLVDTCNALKTIVLARDERRKSDRMFFDWLTKPNKRKAARQ